MGENWFLHRGIKYNIFGLIPKTSYVTQTLYIKYRGLLTSVKCMRPSKMSQEIIYFSVWFFSLPMKNPVKMLSTRYTTVTAKETIVTVEIIKVILIMRKYTSWKNQGKTNNCWGDIIRQGKETTVVGKLGKKQVVVNYY